MCDNMFKVYRLDGVSGIIAILLLLTLLMILAILLSPLFIGAVLLILIYLGYRKFKKSIKEFIKNINKKKIKIKNESQNGEVKIHFAKSISIESEREKKQGIQNKKKGQKPEESKLTISVKDNNKDDKDNNMIKEIPPIAIEEDGIKIIPEDSETKGFITYLIEKGLKFENNLLYYNDKLVYPVYKKSYPINEIIRLYDNKPEVDVIILGLKGEPHKPKFIYIIPIEHAKERMTIDELRGYLTSI